MIDPDGHPEFPWIWNFTLKVLYLTTSFYILAIMMKVYARTREQEKAWKLGAYCLGAAIVLGPVLAAIAKGKETSLFEVSWTFSIVLESVCVIPQLLLLRQTSVPTVIDSGYIIFLGAYRALYILNWIVRFATKDESNPSWRAVVFGIIQTALYVDFAWVYYTRQRVKLRNGGIVDQDDLSRGFLVGKLFGRADGDTDEERGQSDSNGAARVGSNANGGRWGKRGVSVSADDDLPQTGAKPKGLDQSKAQGNDDLEDFVDDESDDEVPSDRQQATGLIRGQRQ